MNILKEANEISYLEKVLDGDISSPSNLDDVVQNKNKNEGTFKYNNKEYKFKKENGKYKVEESLNLLETVFSDIQGKLLDDTPEESVGEVNLIHELIGSVNNLIQELNSALPNLEEHQAVLACIESTIENEYYVLGILEKALQELSSNAYNKYNGIAKAENIIQYDDTISSNFLNKLF